MRFYDKEKPKKGDTRTRTKFAWFPIRIKNVRVWLEKYQINEIYEAKYLFHMTYEEGWVELSRNTYDPPLFY